LLISKIFIKFIIARIDWELMRPITILALICFCLILTGCSNNYNQEKPPQIANYESFTVSPSKFHVFHVPKAEGYKYASITVKSDQKINVWVMPTNEDVEKFLDKKGKYEYIPHLSRLYDNEYFSSSVVDTDMYVVVTNAGTSDAHVEIWIVQSQFRVKYS